MTVLHTYFGLSLAFCVRSFVDVVVKSSLFSDPLESDVFSGCLCTCMNNELSNEFSDIFS